MTKHAREARWCTSSYTEGQDCVELAFLDAATVGVRDSKAPETDHLTIRPAELAVLVNRIKAGDLDL